MHVDNKLSIYQYIKQKHRKSFISNAWIVVSLITFCLLLTMSRGHPLPRPPTLSAASNTTLLWQKESTLENEISRKWAMCVRHVHWHQWNLSLCHVLNIFQQDESLCSKSGPGKCQWFLDFDWLWSSVAMVVTIVCRDTINCKDTIVWCNGALK